VIGPAKSPVLAGPRIVTAMAETQLDRLERKVDALTTRVAELTPLTRSTLSQVLNIANALDTVIAQINDATNLIAGKLDAQTTKLDAVNTDIQTVAQVSRRQAPDGSRNRSRVWSTPLQ
jgi:methyl-accepting chemotaxis protein